VLLRLFELQALGRAVEFHQYLPGLDLPADLEVVTRTWPATGVTTTWRAGSRASGVCAATA